MLITKILSAITAIKDILVLVKNAFGALAKEWRQRVQKQQSEDVKKGLEKAEKEGDQRDLEEAMGSDNAGKPTKHKLGSLQKRPPKDRS